MAWQQIAEISISGTNWGFSPTTTAYWFRLRQRNAPKDELLLVCQSDGESLLVNDNSFCSSDDFQLICLQPPGFFPIARRVGIRLKQADQPINNWIVSIDAWDSVTELFREPDLITSIGLGYSEAVIDSNCLVGQALYLKQSGHIDLASASNNFSSFVVGIAVEDKLAGNSVKYATEGIVEKADWSYVADGPTLQPGAVYYLSPQFPGNLTATAPTVPGQNVCAIGQALSTTQLSIEVQSVILL